ncbi:MAG TPA: hypothetical protein VFT87_00580, partial [Candidatus Saccharimonadales bacterium]|nr:hypothetical protein [Candidatus Saccharimonadales bacterium]
MAFIWLWGTGVILGTGLLMATATLRQLWRYRKVLGKVVVILFLASSALLTMGGLSTGATILLVSIQAWFVLLGARLWFGRLEEPFLRPST